MNPAPTSFSCIVYRTCNIGDMIQTLALSRLLPPMTGIFRHDGERSGVLSVDCEGPGTRVTHAIPRGMTVARQWEHASELLGRYRGFLSRNLGRAITPHDAAMPTPATPDRLRLPVRGRFMVEDIRHVARTWWRRCRGAAQSPS